MRPTLKTPLPDLKGDLQFTTRTFNVLMRELSHRDGYQEIPAKVGEVLACTEDRLIGMRNLGRRCTNEVLNWQLRVQGLLDPMPDPTDTQAVQAWLTKE